VRSTRSLVEALGGQVLDAVHETGGKTTRNLPVDAVRRVAHLLVDSPGVDGIRAPLDRLDCGNSGTTLRLFAGILAGQQFEAVLDGDASLRWRPVERVAEPRRAMGADVHGADGGTAPVRIRGRHPLRAIDWTPSVASA